jgi:hypothetical protein
VPYHRILSALVDEQQIGVPAGELATRGDAGECELGMSVELLLYLSPMDLRPQPPDLSPLNRSLLTSTYSVIGQIRRQQEVVSISGDPAVRAAAWPTQPPHKPNVVKRWIRRPIVSTRYATLAMPAWNRVLLTS